MRSTVLTSGMLALLASVGALAVQGCSGEVVGTSRGASAEGGVGNITLNLLPVSGVTINSVNYVVTGTPAIAGTALPSGVLPTPGTAREFTFGIPVPVGTGYTLSLTAVSAETGDDITCTGSHGPFDVAPNTSSAFPTTLTCVDNGIGQIGVAVDIETDACPRLQADFATAIPSRASVGSSIALNALGHDLDGKVVTYAWSLPAVSAGVGFFTNATTRAATFTCSSSGDSLPVTVALNNGECLKTLRTTISCNSGDGCGNGSLDPGEDCDPAIPADQPGGSPAGTTFGCPADCRVTCGDGVVESPTEECELNGGPPTAGCTAQCRNREFECGDGFLQPLEACDGTLFPAAAPAGSCCSADCSRLIIASCGDGFVNRCGGTSEECEPRNSETCSNDCQAVADASCVECEANGVCAPFALACLDSFGTSTPADQALCFDVQECIRDTGCAVGANIFTSCFCGALSAQACAAAPATGPGAPAGPCAAQIKAGMGLSATNPQILSRFTSRSFAAGAAINRFNCLKNDPVCSPLCGF